MNKNERALLVSEILNEFFPDPTIALNYSNDFTLLVAVLLSARCTDRMVNRVTEKLFAIATSAEEMLALEEEEIKTLIKSLGLSPQKAKAIKGLSKIISEKYKGKVPRTFEELEALPGVGHKTASVVMASAFHLPAFPVDTHIFRCARRWGLSEAGSVEGVEKDLKKLFPKKQWIKLHLQIINYARQFCPAKMHKKEFCPICLKIDQAREI